MRRWVSDRIDGLRSLSSALPPMRSSDSGRVPGGSVMSRADRAQAVLDALDSGAPAKRPHPPAPDLRQDLCKKGCHANVYFAHLPTGAWCVLDRNPGGELAVVQGFVRTWGAHMGNVPRWSFHRCLEKKQ